ncbi:MAG: phosphoribosylformylglycinamidine synthase subunit PurQ [Phycisphaerales bacterium]|nr:phosphoribosylformylglycinamidine synthase subunit PurQ [Planctomycetota bacterium]MCH8508634.1 phosphoribosylformylglycinamidine synthase subunit PurQ [Phycisphaerales bacterium]
MPETPRALIVRTAGTNCDAELARAFEMAGARPELVHVRALIAEPGQIDGYDLIGFPGGFSYGDDIASGRILAMQVRERLYGPLRRAAERGVAMIGVCNGFQVLTQVGLLPGPEAGAGWPEDRAPEARVALTDNFPPRFKDGWVRVAAEAASACVWTRGLLGDQAEEAMVLPIAHAEGRFVARDHATLTALEAAGQVALRYVDNPNGSMGDVAGICDATGRIFGLMPHPERYLDWNRHPFWTRLSQSARSGPTPGLAMFTGAVEAVRAAAV